MASLASPDGITCHLVRHLGKIRRNERMVRRSLSADARPCPFFRGSGANGSTTGRLDASMEINQRRPHQPNAAAHRSILAGGLFRSLHSLARRLRGKIGLRCVESRENRVGRQAGSLAFRWSDTRFATSCLAGLMAPPPPKVGSGGSRDPCPPTCALLHPHRWQVLAVELRRVGLQFRQLSGHHVHQAQRPREDKLSA